MSNFKLMPYVLLTLSNSVFAQQAPTGGSQLLQLPVIQIPQPVAPRIEVKPSAAMASPDTSTAVIMVNTLRVVGAKAYSEDVLLAQTGFKPGSSLTLAQLRGMAAAVTDFYRRNGYFVAQAYLPAQDILNNTLTIAVMEGQYGNITLRNRSNVVDGLANGLMAGVASGDAITTQPLESQLLLLSDLPGVKVHSTLVPGATPGSSDLIVDLTPGQRVTGSIDADNAGNRYTGTYRLGATINLNEPTGHGDVASLRAVTSGTGLQYARASYQVQFGKAKVGAAISHLAYHLGREFESLGARGTATVGSLYGSYPLIRSRETNLYAGLSFDAKVFRDRVDSTGSVADKRAQVLTASLYGNRNDSWGAGGQSVYSVALSAGNIDLQSPLLRDLDTISARSNGHFSKLAASAARLQNVTDRFSVYLAASGQMASKNLDPSEKMALGGMYAVRAYPEGEAFADEGYLLTLEGRLQLGPMFERQVGQLQLIGFVDTGTVTANKNPWTTGNNRRTLSGAGVGVNWTFAQDFMVRAYYAHKLGDAPALSAPDARGRFWIQAVKYF